MNNPEVDLTNNHTGNELRHSIIMKKIFGGKSNNKADTIARLLSIMQTIEMQKAIL